MAMELCIFCYIILFYSTKIELLKPHSKKLHILKTFSMSFNLTPTNIHWWLNKFIHMMLVYLAWHSSSWKNKYWPVRPLKVSVSPHFFMLMFKVLQQVTTTRDYWLQPYDLHFLRKHQLNLSSFNGCLLHNWLLLVTKTCYWLILLLLIQLKCLVTIGYY